MIGSGLNQFLFNHTLPPRIHAFAEQFILQLRPQTRSRWQLRLPIRDDRQCVDQLVVERADVRTHGFLEDDVRR